MIKWFNNFENKIKRNALKFDFENEININDKNYKISSLSYLLETKEEYDNKNLELSINEYVSKIRKQLILIEKLKQNINPQQLLLNKNISQKSISYSRKTIRSKEELFKKLRKSTVRDISNIIWNEPEQYGQEMTMALNVMQIPFLKFRINPIETLKEIEYIFKKKTRTINEMIYLQHLLTLYDVVPSIYIHYDLIEPNEVLFNMAICLNMHKYNKNEMIFRYGDYNDKLFFVLSGSISLFEPFERKCEMTINQYIQYLNHLETMEEYELIKKIIEINKIYRNDKTVLKIKTNIDKVIRKKYLQKLRASKEENKYQDNTPIEVNLNLEINNYINVLEDYINCEEIISCEKYLKSIEPNFDDEKKDKKNEEEKKEDDNENNEKNCSNDSSEENNKRVIKYYIYKFVKNAEPFDIFGEMILDEDEDIKNRRPSNKNVNSYKKREFTAISNESSRILYLDNVNWIKYFKCRQESIKMKNLSTILDIPFLRNINKDYFKSKIFEHFSLFYYKIGDYIFKQKEKRKKIYFIRTGEVQLIMKSSVYGINKIIDKKFDKKDIMYRNKISKLQQIEYNDSDYLINQLNNDKRIKTWKILGIYPKDIIGLDEIIDENNKYYMSAKCSSYHCEIYEIDYNKFKDMVNEDENVENLYIQYTKNKVNFLSKRLKTLRTLYINNKLEIYKNYLKKNFSFEDINKSRKNKSNNINKKKYLKLGIFNNNLYSSPSSNNLQSLSDNLFNLKSDNTESVYNSNTKDSLKPLTPVNKISRNNKLSSKNNTYEESNKKSNKLSPTHNKYRTIYSSYKRKKSNKKLNLDLDNYKYIEENKFTKTQNLFKTKFQRLIKFKEFNKLIIEHKKSELNKKINIQFNNSFFKNYIKKFKILGTNNKKKTKINPVNDLFLSLCENKNNKKYKGVIKSNSSSNIEYAATNRSNIQKNKKFHINKVECLIFDKIIDKQGYSKYNENNKNNSNTQILKEEIKNINKKKPFPQHLIRRFEINRKINYFPEKLLHFVK